MIHASFKMHILLIVALLVGSQLTSAQSLTFAYDSRGNMITKTFKSPIPDKPVITLNGGLLTSNALNGNQWYLDNAPIPGATEQTYKPSINGTYKVKVTNKYGCISDFSAALDLFATGIISLPNNQYVKIGPNPAQRSVTVYFHLDNIPALNLTLYDVNGKMLIYKENVQNNYSLDLSSLSAGAYLIKLVSRNGKINVTIEFLKTQ